MSVIESRDSFGNFCYSRSRAAYNGVGSHTAIINNNGKQLNFTLSCGNTITIDLITDCQPRQKVQFRLIADGAHAKAKVIGINNQ